MGELHGMKGLSDQELLAGLRAAVGRSRTADAEVIRFIAEVDRRKLFRQAACSSMFRYCVERLGMAECSAYRRIKVARLARRLPVVLDHFADGRVHLAALDELASHLTEGNVAAILERARGMSVRSVRELVAELAPKPDVKTSVRKASVRRSSPGNSDQADLLSSTRVAPAKPANVRPLAPARYHVSFTASEALKKNLDKARELAGYGATVEGLIEDAVALLVGELEKKKLGVRGRKAGKVANPRGRYIAKAVRREVFGRDGGRCTYVDEHGRRCSERKGLHLDHVVPFASGGTSTADNLRLRCGPHNQLAAEQCFGPLFIASRREAR